tara:strand:- start:131 stop:703 length:573 start_codon:yes stop_codon:yes gene_type:complete
MKNEKKCNKGMTLPELVLAIFMLIAFTGFTVMIVQYISRFFQPLNEEAKEEYISSNKELQDVLNHHMDINKAFDSIIELFSEPGIDKKFISNLECTALPSLEWKIPSKKITVPNSDEKMPLIDYLIPKSYKICIKPTSLSESSYSELSSGTGKPGIYILYSKPENGVSVNATPVRRIFCRPKPFCTGKKL